MYGKRCLRSGCTGRVTFEVGLAELTVMQFAQGTFSVLGYTAVQSAQVLCLSFRWGSCVEMFTRSRVRRFVDLSIVTRLDIDTKAEEVMALTGKQSEFLSTLNRTVKKYLDENARRWVDMQNLFSFMKV